MITKNKPKWLCFYAPPFDGDEYDGHRLFIKDGDPTRVFVCDNSGKNPDRADQGPRELVLSVPGVLNKDGYKDGSLPSSAQFATKCGSWCDVHPLEAVVLLVEKWGATLYSQLSDEITNKALLLAKTIQLAKRAPTCVLDVCSNRVGRGRTMCRECSNDPCLYGSMDDCSEKSIRGSEFCAEHSEED